MNTSLLRGLIVGVMITTLGACGEDGQGLEPALIGGNNGPLVRMRG